MIVVTGGTYSAEVSWALSCDDGTAVSGGNPYGPTPVMAALGAFCTLTMTDSWGDGWNGATWLGLGQSLTMPSGSGPLLVSFTAGNPLPPFVAPPPSASPAA